MVVWLLLKCSNKCYNNSSYIIKDPPFQELHLMGWHMTSFSTEVAHYHPKSHTGADTPQWGSSLVGAGISWSGSSLSFAGLSWSVFLAPGAEFSQARSSLPATLPKTTSSQKGDHDCPTALSFRKVDDSGDNNMMTRMYVNFLFVSLIAAVKILIMINLM